MKRNELLTIGTCLVLTACAVDNDSSLAGSCKLSCSTRRVAAAEYEIVPLLPEGDEEISMPCEYPFATNQTSIGPLGGPVQVRYQIYEKVPPFGGANAEAAAGAGQAAGGAGFADPILAKRPVAGVGFEPYILTPTGTAADKTNPEHKAGDQVTPYKFSGVVTPKSEWCSDSCGVMTYEVWPVCIEGKTSLLAAAIAVSGAIPTRIFKYSFENSEE